MKLHSPTEHAIYAAAFVKVLHHEVGQPRPASFQYQEWADRAADIAARSGEVAVEAHRGAMRRRRS